MTDVAPWVRFICVLWIILFNRSQAAGVDPFSILAFYRRKKAPCAFGPHLPVGEKAAPLPVSVTSAFTSHRMKSPPDIRAFTSDKAPSSASLAGGAPLPQHARI